MCRPCLLVSWGYLQGIMRHTQTRVWRPEVEWFLVPRNLSTAAAVGFEASTAWGTESLLVYFPNIIQIDKMLSVVMVSRNYWQEIIKISKVPRHLKRILIKINEIPLWKILQLFWNCFILIECIENLHYLWARSIKFEVNFPFHFRCFTQSFPFPLPSSLLLTQHFYYYLFIYF